MAQRREVVVAALAGAVILADQATKALVRSALGVNTSVAVIDGVVSITHVRNAGAAFGLLQGQRWLFVLTGVLVLGAVGVALWRLRPASKALLAGLALVAGGAIGNLIDRVATGRVTDFIDFGWFPVFNVADIALDVGVAFIVWWLLFGHGSEHAGGSPGEDRPPGPQEETG